MVLVFGLIKVALLCSSAQAGSYVSGLLEVDGSSSVGGSSTIGGRMDVAKSVTIGLNLEVSGLTNCDTIDTDGNGLMSCGTDGGGGGAYSLDDSCAIGCTTDNAMTLSDSLDVAGHVAIGSGASIGADLLYIKETSSVSSAIINGVLTASPGAAAVGLYYGYNGSLYWETTDYNAGSEVGGLNFATLVTGGITAGHATNLDIFGINITGLVSLGNNTITADTLRGIQLKAFTDGFGNNTVTIDPVYTLYLYDSDTPDAGGFANFGQIYIEEPTAGVNNYAILVAGGKSGFGTITPVSEITIGDDGDAADEYMQIDAEDGAPPPADCNANDESGRMILDYTQDRLYICNQRSGRGWDYITLTD